jgi:hypothetical protein
VADCFNDLERTLDRIDPFWAECALSLRSAQAFGRHRPARSGQDAAVRITPRGVILRTVIDDYRELEIYRAQYERGDATAILRAFACAFGHSLPPPAWAVDAFLDRLDQRARLGGAPSLDDLFGAVKANTARQRAQQTRDWRIGCELWSAVVEALAAGRASSLTTALRQVLAARHWGVASTKARALVEAVERVQRPLIGGTPLAEYGRQAISRKAPKARRAST